jgi:hypothetical protein
MVVVMVLVNHPRRGDVPPGRERSGAEMSVFVPLSVNPKLQKVFQGTRGWQKSAVMDRREEHALYEVERIGVAVEHLRSLLLAATKAELRANSRQRAAEAAGDR